MVLSDDSADRLVFRFRSRLWGAATLGAGVALLGTTAWLHLHHPSRVLPFVPLYLFGALLLYSALYSFTADQWLAVDGSSRSIHFHKRNLYGRVDWERSAEEFTEVRVSRASTPRRASNWTIALV